MMMRLRYYGSTPPPEAAARNSTGGNLHKRLHFNAFTTMELLFTTSTLKESQTIILGLYIFQMKVKKKMWLEFWPERGPT